MLPYYHVVYGGHSHADEKRDLVFFLLAFYPNNMAEVFLLKTDE